MQEFRIAHDVIRAGRTDQRHIDVFRDERFQKRLPWLSPGRGVFVGEVEHLHAVFAVQPRHFPGQLQRITVPPAGPEPALTAVGAQVRTAARELDDNGPLATPIAVSGMIDEFPANAVVIEVADHRSSPCCQGCAITAKGNAAHLVEVAFPAQGLHKLADGFLAFTTHDHIDPGFAFQNIAPEIGGMNAAIDNVAAWQAAAHGARDRGDHRMAGRRTGMAKHYGIRRKGNSFGYKLVQGHRAKLTVDESHVMPIVDQWPTHGEQPKRWQVIVRNPAANCGMRDVYQDDTQLSFPERRLSRVWQKGV